MMNCNVTTLNRNFTYNTTYWQNEIFSRFDDRQSKQTSSLLKNFELPDNVTRLVKEAKNHIYEHSSSLVYENADALITLQKNNNKLLIQDNALQENLRILHSISDLAPNWDGYGAAPLSSELIRKVEDIIIGLQRQPEVFPTAAGTIQLEYDGINGFYLEIQIHESKPSKVFCIDKKQKKHEWTLEPSAGKLNEIVRRFYG